MRPAWLILLAPAAFFPGYGAWVRSGPSEDADRTSCSPAPRAYLGRVVVTGHLPLPGRVVQTQPALPVDEHWAKGWADKLATELRREGYTDARISARLVSSGYRRADLHLDVDAGTRYTLAEPTFTGDPRIAPARLRRALHRGRFRSRPAYSVEAVQGDLVRLRSFYTTQGYLDARITAGSERRQGTRVTVSYTVDAGPRQGLAGRAPREACRCLLAARAQADREGRIDFHPILRTVPDDRGQVRFETEATAGEPWFISRITFTGHHRFGDATLRRALLLDEGAPFDQSLLARSLVRLSRLGVVEPVSEQNVRVSRDPETRTVRLEIAVKETAAGRWSISGPVGTPAIGGSLTASLSTRLPAPTYLASVGWLAFGPAWLKLVPGALTKPWFPYVALQRPFLPGQEWTTGFTLSPQLGLKNTASLYALTQTRGRLQTLLLSDKPAEAPLVVPVLRAGGLPPAVLLCEDTRSRWTPMRGAAAMMMEWLLSPAL